MSKVSVIMPCYNNARWLPKCIESCLLQTDDYLKEIIVVDDASTDNSWEVLTGYQKKYPNRLKLIKNTDKGANNARNKGFEHATGEFIQWLDSDDFLLPEKFKTQVNFLEQNRKTDIVYSDWQMDFYEKNKRIRSQQHRGQNYDDYLYQLLIDNWQPCHNYLLRRSMAQKLHNLKAWYPATLLSQDREYFTRAAIQGAKFHYVAGNFAVYNRWNTKSISEIDFKKRLQLTLELENKFYVWIAQNNKISSKNKRKYFRIINTNALKANFYSRKIKIARPFPFRQIKWTIIHYKMRLVMPFIYFRTHWILFLKPNRYSMQTKQNT